MAKYVMIENHSGKRFLLFGGMYGVFQQIKNKCKDAGCPIDIVSGWRGQKEQDDLKAKGLSRAKFGLSPHNFGLAFDYCPLNGMGRFVHAERVADELWAKIGAIVIANGLEWGGNFKSIHDPDHAENKDWQSLIKDGSVKLLFELPDSSDIEVIPA